MPLEYISQSDHSPKESSTSTTFPDSLSHFFLLIISCAGRLFNQLNLYHSNQQSSDPYDHLLILFKFINQSIKMRYSIAFAAAALASSVSAHGVITSVQGANGVTMPGLSIIDGTPRDSGNPLSGSEADTSIIRTKEMGGKASALGRTQGGGPVDAAAAISTFMGGAGGAATGAAAGTKRGLLDALTGGAGGAGAAAAGGAAGGAAGAKTAKGTKEAGVAAAAGAGAASGLPTTSADGTVTMTFHQVNQDGAGPLTAMIDATSGGTDPAAFQKATVTQNVPGIGIGGLSAASSMDFPVKVRSQPPPSLTLSANTSTGPDAPGHDLPGYRRWRHKRLRRPPAERGPRRSLRWLRCLHPVHRGQEARRRVQPPQAPLRPRHPRQARVSLSLHHAIGAHLVRLKEL